MFYGQGAGKLPTASAVCSDIIECLNKDDKQVIWETKDVSIHKSNLKNLTEEIKIPILE